MEILGRLKPAFKPGGSTTAGNTYAIYGGISGIRLEGGLGERSHLAESNFSLF